MNNMAIVPNQTPRQVYVIIRVFDLTTPNVSMKIYVDPLRLQGRWIKFEVQNWIGITL